MSDDEIDKTGWDWQQKTFWPNSFPCPDLKLNNVRVAQTWLNQLGRFKGNPTEW